MKKLLALLLAAVPVGCEPAHSRNWDESATTKEVAAWFQALKQPDNTVPCCGEADAYYADSFEVHGTSVIAIITDERVVPNRPPIPVGTKIIIPPNKVTHQGNPTGHGIVFVVHRDDDDDAPNNGWHVYCYVTPGLF
jgi:hypothetical protein